jgi:hypothetical protein
MMAALIAHWRPAIREAPAAKAALRFQLMLLAEADTQAYPLPDASDAQPEPHQVPEWAGVEDPGGPAIGPPGSPGLVRTWS